MLLVERNVKACYCAEGMCGLCSVCMELEGEKLKYGLARACWKSWKIEDMRVSLHTQESEINKDQDEEEDLPTTITMTKGS